MMKYKEINQNELNINLNLFNNLFITTYTKQGKSINNIKVNKNIIAEIEVRVHQRAAYYRFFHGFDINEIKEAALRSYWILKYKPFSHKIEQSPDEDEDENVFFAFWSLIHTIGGCIKTQHLKLNPNSNKFDMIKFPEPLIKSALHTFRECDMSKESMIEYAHTLHALLICYNK